MENEISIIFENENGERDFWFPPGKILAIYRSRVNRNNNSDVLTTIEWVSDELRNVASNEIISEDQLEKLEKTAVVLSRNG
jgi:F420-0:gamma-glutamyl ligase-like protein